VFKGELPTSERDKLLAGAFATVLLGAWPEPFGLVAIESMATGTPVIARRAGALPEIVDHGVTGCLVDDVHEGRFAVQGVATLDRRLVRRTALDRFSVSRMVDEYEGVYRRLAANASVKPSAKRRADEHVSIVGLPSTSAHEDNVAIVDRTSRPSARSVATASPNRPG
jgi:hypothetical protein